MPGKVVLRMLGMLDRRVLWRVPTRGNEVFLTFDDGPEPTVTPWVLDTLAAHGAKATFFCLGRHAEQHPQLFQRLRDEGHSVGHHTWDHPSGWQTPTRSYYRSVLRGAEQVGGELFRPPYGRMKIGQSRTVGRRFQVVMWDVLGGDFRKNRSGASCASYVLRRAKPGSIVVLHDNLKSTACLKEALPLILEGWARKGYRCAPLGAALATSLRSR